jgi:NTE family protein
VSGISIGAINAAIIAGNPAERRLERLEQLWADISRPDGWGHLLTGDLRRWFDLGSAMEAILWGQPNFFVPRMPGPLLVPGGPQATSFYDTGPLRASLLRLTDFDLINRGEVRISLGATRVRTGELVFFDSRRNKIGPEHVMASGALPPGFPAVAVEGDLYWDGGCVSNTPLEAVVDDPPEVDTLVFMIDLWGGAGRIPTTMDDVLWRQKQIQYASRTRAHLDACTARLQLRRAHAERKRRPGAAADRPVSDAEFLTSGPHMHIVHLVYHPTADQVAQSDAEFSRASIADRRVAGYTDMQAAIRSAPWDRPANTAHGCTSLHRIERGEITTVATAA